MKKENTPTATPLLPPGCRVLIVKLSSIGDVLHATAVVHNLRRLAPDAEITWLASPPGSTLLEGNPDIDRLLIWDRRPCDQAMQKLHLRTCWQELRKAKNCSPPAHSTSRSTCRACCSPASSRSSRVRRGASASMNATKATRSS